MGGIIETAVPRAILAAEPCFPSSLDDLWSSRPREGLARALEGLLQRTKFLCGLRGDYQGSSFGDSSTSKDGEFGGIESENFRDEERETVAPLTLGGHAQLAMAALATLDERGSAGAARFHLLLLPVLEHALRCRFVDANLPSLAGTPGTCKDRGWRACNGVSKKAEIGAYYATLDGFGQLTALTGGGGRSHIPGVGWWDRGSMVISSNSGLRCIKG